MLHAGDVLYGSDLSGDPANAAITAAASAWHAFIDLDPPQAFATRQRLLHQAAPAPPRNQN